MKRGAMWVPLIKEKEKEYKTTLESSQEKMEKGGYERRKGR